MIKVALPDLVIEDGSCVDGANTFIDAVFLKEFACLQLDGQALEQKLNDLSDDDIKRILYAAMRELKCIDFCGTQKAESDLPFPRENCSYSDTWIPNDIKEAQALLAIRLCEQLGSASTTSGSGGVILKSMKIKDNSFVFKNGAIVNGLSGENCEPQIEDCGSQAPQRSDRLECLIGKFKRKPKIGIQSLRICH